MVDLDRLEQVLVHAARERRAMTYGQLLAFFERRVTRITVQALCRDLGRVAPRFHARGWPDPACLVVRRADGLPGEGWFTWARRARGYEGDSTGAAAAAFVVAEQSRLFEAAQAREDAGHDLAAPATLGRCLPDDV